MQRTLYLLVLTCIIFWSTSYANKLDQYYMMSSSNTTVDRKYRIDNTKRFKKFNNEKIVVLNGDNRDFTCNYRKITLSKKMNLRGEKLVSKLQKSSFDPECLSFDMKYQIEGKHLKKKAINGISFGWNVAGSVGIGAMAGKEFVILINDDNSIQVGVVGFYGLSVDISLPVGAAITSGVLYGKCASIGDYLGNFESVTAAGVSYNMGTTGSIIGIGRKKSGCNSASFTIGASTPLLSASSERYIQLSDFITIKGERVKEMIKYFKDRNNSQNDN